MTPTRPLEPTTDPRAPSAAEKLSIEHDDPRLDPYRRILSPEEFRGFHAWLTTFYPFQLEWFFDEGRFVAANKSRQIGWTHTTAAILVIWAAFRGEPCTILSKGEKESAKVLEMCKQHIAILRDFGLEEWVAAVTSSTEEIVFASGGRITALASTGGRSFSGNLFLDEFAYHQHPEAVWESAAPTTMVGRYKLRLVSTPNGIGNKFHNLWEVATGTRELVFDDPRVPKNIARVGWSAYEVPLQTAINQGYPVDLAACWHVYAGGDPRLFDQLFNCSFLDSVLQYFTSDKINACRTRLAIEPDGRGIYYAGLDIGREVDLTCLIVVRMLNGKVAPVHVETMKRTDQDGMKAMVAWAFKAYNLRRLCIDATGLGSFPADDMKKKHGDRFDVSHRRNKVEPIDFGLKSKEGMATNAYSMMSNARLLLPDGDAQIPSFKRRNLSDKGDLVNEGPEILVNEPGTAEVIRKELGAIQRKITASGNVTYDAPRTKDGHADRAWALLLALYAVDDVNPMVAALQERAGLTPQQGR